MHLSNPYQDHNNKERSFVDRSLDQWENYVKFTYVSSSFRFFLGSSLAGVNAMNVKKLLPPQTLLQAVPENTNYCKQSNKKLPKQQTSSSLSCTFFLIPEHLPPKPKPLLEAVVVAAPNPKVG